MTAAFPNLDHLFGAYLNQDYELTADTIEGVLAEFVRTSSPAQVEGALREVDLFRRSYADQLDAEFLRRYGFDFDPKLWDLTTDAFFDVVVRVLDGRSGRQVS